MNAKSGERRAVILLLGKSMGVGVVALLVIAVVVGGQRAWHWLMNFLGLDYR